MAEVVVSQVLKIGKNKNNKDWLKELILIT